MRAREGTSDKSQQVLKHLKGPITCTVCRIPTSLTSDDWHIQHSVYWWCFQTISKPPIHLHQLLSRVTQRQSSTTLITRLLADAWHAKQAVASHALLSSSHWRSLHNLSQLLTCKQEPLSRGRFALLINPQIKQHNCVPTRFLSGLSISCCGNNPVSSSEDLSSVTVLSVVLLVYSWSVLPALFDVNLDVSVV